MTEKAVVLDFDTKNEKLKNIENRIKAGTKGKAKLGNMKQLLERNSEQVKQKISEYFESCRKLIDEREAKLLNKVNTLIDRRIAEIEDKLKQFQRKLDYLNAYHCSLEDERFIEWHTSDEFDYFVAAPRYDFHTGKNEMRSMFRKVGTFKRRDVLVTKLDSSDEDDSDDLYEENVVVYDLIKPSKFSNKSTEAESSDDTASCSLLSYKEGEEYEDEKNKIKGLDGMDDYDFPLLESSKQQLCENSIIEVGKVPSANVNPEYGSVTCGMFEREIMTGKMLEVLNNLKVNGAEINKVGGQITKEERSYKTIQNKEPSLAEKLSNTLKLCPPLNQEKETSSKVHSSFKNCPLSVSDTPLSQNFKVVDVFDVLNLRTVQHFDHSNLISDFNSRVQIILSESASQMQMDV